MLDRRLENTTNPGSPKSPSKTPISPNITDLTTPRSVYREILFLTLIAMGQDNIDLTAFNREYRRAFDRLTGKHLGLIHKCDKPPSPTTSVCNRLFKDLRLQGSKC